MLLHSSLLLRLLGAAAAAAAASPPPALPIVDLGYERHQAIAFNESGNYYNFSNIRFAAPPTGNNRFRVPQPPAQNRGAVQTGSVDRICPQADPGWETFAAPWIMRYIFGGQPNVTMAQYNAVVDKYNLTHQPPVDPRTSEDCLFLDVMVPKPIFDATGKANSSSSSSSSSTKNATAAPVVVWIYGGGFTVGSKSSQGDPAGLIARSLVKSGEGIVYVALNYRLGAFGWLAGSSLQADGVANAGLYDQRFALDWVKKNIHLFGGDPNRVTIMGESAGASSILHQITAFGGQKEIAFNQAILQSPAYFPLASNYVVEQTFQQLLNYTSTTSLAELRNVSTTKLQAANFLQVYQAPYGQFTYGPAVDGAIVPALAPKLLLQGSYYHDLKVMVGHNSDEGLVFTSPFVQTQSQLVDFIKASLPEIQPAVVSYLVNDLYPPVSNGSYNYRDPIARLALLISEFAINCNAFSLDKAFGNNTYAYLFDVPPGIHGQDVAYTFYNGGGADFSTLLYNTSVAIAMQDFFVTFAQNSVPTTPDFVSGIPKFNMYGNNATVEDIGTNSILHAHDPAANQRCDWWQKGLFA